MKRTKILPLITFTFLFITQSAFAQTETFGAIKYSTPGGFTKSASEQAVVFSSSIRRRVTFASSRSTPRVGARKSAEGLRTRMEDAGRRSVEGGANPKTESVPDNGWTGVAGGGLVDFQGNKAFAFLTVISGFGKSVSVLAILNDESFLPPFQAFVERIDIDKTTVATPAAAPPAAAAPSGNSASVPDRPSRLVRSHNRHTTDASADYRRHRRSMGRERGH